jgi:sialidase-1
MSRDRTADGGSSLRRSGAVAGFATLAALALAHPPLAEAGATLTAEGTLESFLGEPKLDIQQVYKGNRFPNVVVAVDGTVLAFWNGVKVRRSEDGGETWGPEVTVGKGFMGGGVTVNETDGDIFAFVEKHHPPAPLTVYQSRDHGKTWARAEVVIKPDAKGNVPSMHMNEHGITLRHGRHKGRLLRPARHYAGQNHRSKWPQHYTTAIFSDDGGKTWQTSAPFPAFGTGEATVAELADGRIYYNSRRHWAPEGANPRRRWTASSDDGGATWKNLSICDALPDGPQNTDYGCMAGLVRLPVKDRDILLYSNCDSPGGRRRGTVWASFDGGRTWPLKRLIFEGGFAYSSLDTGRPATKSQGWIYCQFESGGAKVARFNLSWLLQGKKTSDGDVPDWLSR